MRETEKERQRERERESCHMFALSDDGCVYSCWCVCVCLCVCVCIRRVDGDLEGRVEEFAEGGFLVYSGDYQASRRHGPGTLHFRDGSRICGHWEEGTLHGAAKFFYPDGVSGLEGLWKEGDMEQARYFGPTPPQPPLHKKCKKAGLWSDVVFKADETTEMHMGHDLLLRDPYETLVNVCLRVAHV